MDPNNTDQPDRRHPKHEEISKALREEVISGHYGTEGRLPSEAQLVKRFLASRPTVARALRTLQEEELVERRAGAGSFVIPFSKRSASASRHCKTLAMLIPDLRNTEIFQQIAGEIASLARVKGYSILWGSTGGPKLDSDVSLEHGESLAKQFIERRVDGVFFTPYELVEGKSKANRRMAQSLHDAGIPLILIDRDFLPFPRRGAFDVVGIDNIAGGYALGEHLIKLGARKICFVHPKHSAATIGGRIAGLRAAIDEKGLTWNSKSVFEGNPGDPLSVRKIIGEGQPDAIVGSNDHTAAVLLQTLTKCQIPVPGELRVAGFDDVGFATLVSPTLTTMRQPCQDIARAAFLAMLERMEDPTIPARQISLVPRLIVRDSCGAYLKR